MANYSEFELYLQVWHLAHKNLLYHIDTEPNNEFIIPLSL